MKIVKIWVFAALMLLLSIYDLSAQQTMRLKNNIPVVAENGQVQFSWQGGVSPYSISAQYEAQSNFIEVYKGDSNSYFMSGIPKGQHVFLLNDSQGTSLRLSVNANYPPDSQVKMFLFLGLILFLLLLAIVTKGFFKHGRKTA